MERKGRMETDRLDRNEREYVVWTLGRAVRMCEKAALFDNAAYAEDAQELVENVLENLCEAWGMAPDGKDAGGGLKDGADGLLPDKE